MESVSGNTVLVTGGGTGIGLGLAVEFLNAGNTVIIAGRRQNVLEDAVAKHPGLKPFVLDVSSSYEVIAAAVEQLVHDYPELNVLVNNAGIAQHEKGGIDLAISEAIINTNIVGVIRLTSALLPQLRKQASASDTKRATIITVTSGLAHVPIHVAPTYCATKAFIHSWSQSLRHQLSQGDQATTIDVIEITPPYVQTELGGQHQKTDPRAMPLDEYISETWGLLQQRPLAQPDGSAPFEVLVERVKRQRFAEKSGKYQEVFQFAQSIYSEQKKGE
eukprot:TRINITY_DN1819_c2_g1_i2.p1 TRINITY_DN1819_c2_g1~~TRINITY_DN1819_c2_g1_i2.p1  ORF type:complete len:275 (-),score=50.50 TRINITY_DN1819_c2_g1_i2:21-845(-)